MTNEELKAAIKYVNDFATDVDDEGLDRDGNARHFFNVVKASSELLQLKEGTHPDMVMVPREQWQPIETYDYKNFPEVWLAAWIEPSEYAKENGASAHWDIGMGRCWHVNTRKFTGVRGGSPTYWCKTNRPEAPARKGNV